MSCISCYWFCYVSASDQFARYRQHSNEPLQHQHPPDNAFTSFWLNLHSAIYVHNEHMRVHVQVLCALCVCACVCVCIRMCVCLVCVCVCVWGGKHISARMHLIAMFVYYYICVCVHACIVHTGGYCYNWYTCTYIIITMSWYTYRELYVVF